jgi:hypothetical protein
MTQQASQTTTGESSSLTRRQFVGRAAMAGSLVAAPTLVSASKAVAGEAAQPGRPMEQIEISRGWNIKSVVFDSPEVVPDDAFIVRVLKEADQVERTYLAVGSGTITDITRFVSHRTIYPLTVPSAYPSTPYRSRTGVLGLRIR